MNKKSFQILFVLVSQIFSTRNQLDSVVVRRKLSNQLDSVVVRRKRRFSLPNFSGSSLIVLKVYCHLVIPLSYREDALLDLTDNYNQKPFNIALGDLWKYTVSSFDYYVNLLIEFWMRIFFHAEKFLVRLASDVGIPKSEY